MPVTILDYDPADALTSPEAIEVFLSEAFATGDAGYVAHAFGVVSRAKGLEDISPDARELMRSLAENGDPSLDATLTALKAIRFEIAAKCAPAA